MSTPKIAVNQVWMSASGNVFAITEQLDDGRFDTDRLGYFANNGIGEFIPCADESPVIHVDTLGLPAWHKIGNSRVEFERWADKQISDNLEEEKSPERYKYISSQWENMKSIRPKYASPESEDEMERARR